MSRGECPYLLLKPTSLKGQVMVQVKAFNYLEIERGCLLSCSQNADAVCQKSQHSLLVERFEAPIYDWCTEPLSIPSGRVHMVQISISAHAIESTWFMLICKLEKTFLQPYTSLF